MKIALDIKNMSKIMHPTTDDIIMYDGNNKWYVTKKSDILKEVNELLNQCKQILNQLVKENQEFKSQTSKDVLNLANATKKLLELKGEQL